MHIAPKETTMTSESWFVFGGVDILARKTTQSICFCLPCQERSTLKGAPQGELFPFRFTFSPHELGAWKIPLTLWSVSPRSIKITLWVVQNHLYVHLQVPITSLQVKWRKLSFMIPIIASRLELMDVKAKEVVWSGSAYLPVYQHLPTFYYMYTE